jgi:hypothetical protein
MSDAVITCRPGITRGWVRTACRGLNRIKMRSLAGQRPQATASRHANRLGADMADHVHISPHVAQPASVPPYR